MALALNDRVQETGTANTTVSFTLSGAVIGFQSFAVIGNGNTTYYSATDNSGNWEVGVGTYSTTGPTLTRTTIIASSNSGSAVTFSGTVNVFVTYPAEKAINVDASGNVQLAAFNATNYVSTFGSATTKAVQFQTLGSDAAVSLAIQPKGTGAIDLAAGSSGVNISNGGTVTAVTRTAIGSGYTTPPTWTASAPTTAGGTTASGTTTLTVVSSTLNAGGTGYTAGDVLTVSGGTFVQAAQITVNTVSSGVIATYTVSTTGGYSVIPTNPVSVTGGTGSSATFNLTSWGITSAGLAISVAGSGYVEQPTVTFSGGGGSGAAAYASVGAEPTIRSLFGGATTSGLAVATSNGTQVKFVDVGDGNRPLHIFGGSTSNAQTGGIFQPISGANIAYSINTGIHNFSTAGRSSTLQFSVSHTASAVNYVQVTGSTTGNSAIISTQGSDSAVSLQIQAKSGGVIRFVTGNGTSDAFRIGSASSTANYMQALAGVAGAPPVLSSQGTDTNIDLTLTPKNTGVTRAGGSALSAENGLILNKTTVATNATVATGYNALSIGPVTLSSGVTITVNSGQRYIVI